MKKEIKALQAIGYYFPVDKAQLVRTLEDISFDHLSQMRSVYKHEYEFGLARMDALIESVVFTTCEVCEKEKSAYGKLPKGWGWYKATNKDYLMCDECQIRYTEKYGKEPEIHTEI